jgi:hypothetical protein
VRTMSRIGFVLLLVGAAMAALGVVGISALVPSLVMGTVMMVVGGAIALIGRGIARSFEQQVLLVQELQTRGIRKPGIVIDAVPFASPHGGAVFQREGAQMVLRIELASDGHKRTVTCHLVENSEQAKARIGKEIVVIEHPEEPSTRAIEGYLPNGRRVPSA